MYPNTDNSAAEAETSHDYYNKLVRLIGLISDTEADEKANLVREYFNAIKALKTTAKEVRDGN